MSGSISAVAPSALNSGSMVERPIITKTITIKKASVSPSVVSLCTLCWSPSPIAREINAAAPMPIPSAMLFITRITGNVKLSAASSLVPSFPTKKVSTRLKATIPIMAKNMGIVRFTSVLPTGPSMSFAFFITLSANTIPFVFFFIRKVYILILEVNVKKKYLLGFWGLVNLLKLIQKTQ